VNETNQVHRSYTSMASLCVSSSSLLAALNLSVPTNHWKLRQILAKTADARNMPQTLGKTADAAAIFSPPDLQAPPGLSLPDRLSPPPGLAQSAGLACSNRSKAAKCLKKGRGIYPSTTSLRITSLQFKSATLKGVSGSDGFVESDTEGTSVGAGSITGSGSSDCEETEPEVKAFQMNANASCFVPHGLRKVGLC